MITRQKKTWISGFVLAVVTVWICKSQSSKLTSKRKKTIMIKYDQIEDYIINNRALQIIHKLGFAEKAVVYYHQNCMDGSCSAALMKILLKERCVSNTEFVPVNYNTEFPMDTVDESAICLMVDFSVPVEVLEQIQAKSVGLLIIDHHKSAVEAILKYQETETPKFGYILGGTNHSGASLVYEIFYNQLQLTYKSNAMEKIVSHCYYHDLWRHNGVITDPSYGFVTAVYGLCEDSDKNTASENIRNFFVEFFEYKDYQDDKDYSSKFLMQIEGYSNIGLQMLKFKDLEAKAYVASGKHCILQQGERIYNFFAVKAPYRAASMVGTTGYMEHPHTNFVAIYEDKPDSEDYVISLRARKGGVDVSEVAKFYEGGGHASAAGFKIKKEVWDAIVNR